MPVQKSPFFCGCLARRPRAPGTVLETPERRDTGRIQEDKSEPCIKLVDASDAANFAVNDMLHSTVLLKETNPLSAAFERACLDRPEDQKVALRKAQGLHELFKQLERSNQKSSEESAFRRGVKRLTPTIGVIGGSMGFVGSLTALDPVANNAFGIVQSVMTIAIGVCGAEMQFQEHVEAILQGATVIERCDEIWDSTRPRGPHVFQALVKVYTDLLDFYFEAMLILQSDSFFLGVQKSRSRQRLPEIASSFKGHTEQLDKFIIQEILALNQKIDDDQMSIKVHGLLDNGNQNKQIEYYNSLKERADEACAWIVSSINFREWLGHSNRDLPIPEIPASKFCILFGDMGSGKSATTSFVVDFLTSHPIFSDSMKPLVCVYYCKNDNETNKARNIYRSILSQVLKRMGQLKPMFLKWHKEAQTKNSLIDPTWDDNALRDFLVDVLQTFSRRIYLVLDGVDECDYNSRDHILQFFERFHKYEAPVNVFLSCRYDESLKERLPPERTILQMQSSRERDRIIAAYLVERLFRHQPKEFQDMIIQELASQANGSAIWLKMVLEYLMRISPSKGQIKRELKHIPPPQSLSKLYRKLFETAAAELPENNRVLECALETLVVSRRLLTMDELTYAVTLQVEEQKIRTLGDAEDYLIDSIRLQQLISPFVSFSDHAGSATVRVVHQSLKDLILEKPASAWGSEGRSENNKQRLASLHSKLSNCCIKYLLLEGLQEKELFPDEQLDTLERREDELGFFGDFNVESDEDQPRESSSSQALSREFDPESAGLGKFFTYAACYWTEHFKDCAPGVLPKGDDIAKLARRGSPTLRNWVETYKRPNLTLSSQRNLNVEDFDELVVATSFGSEAFLMTFLKRKFEKDCIRDESPAEAVKWLMQSGNLDAVKTLLENESLQYRFRDGLFLCQIITICKDAAHTNSANQQKWDELLSILVCDFFSSGDSPFEWANTFLCSAARQGCLPMIEILFAKASKEPDLAKALVAETQVDSPYQSVGEAAFWGHANIVQYLLTQKEVDITPHLHHRTTRDRRNVLHCAASSKNADILRILAERLPSGVEEQSTEGDTPLQLLTFGHHASIEAIRALVDVGKADVNSCPGGIYFSPLRTAIRAKNVEVCRLLVSYGARLDDALQRDAGSGEMGLADDLGEAETSQCVLDILLPLAKS